jgi:hypothetical protein
MDFRTVLANRRWMMVGGIVGIVVAIEGLVLLAMLSLDLADARAALEPPPDTMTWVLMGVGLLVVVVLSIASIIALVASTKPPAQNQKQRP